MKVKSKGDIIIIIGLVVILLAPFAPDFLMEMINDDYSVFNYRFSDMRIIEIIPSIRLFGIFLSIWGFILKWKEK